MSLNLLLFTFSERKCKDNLFKLLLTTKKPDWMFKNMSWFFCGLGLEVYFFYHILICDCDSSRKFERDFEVNDVPPVQDYVVFLRFETAGKRGGSLQNLSGGATATTSMLEMDSHHQKCIWVW